MNKSKKLTATVAASAVASALVAPAAFAGTNFSDIEGSFAKDAIMQLADSGILNGVGGGKFNPTGLIERQDFAIVLAKALKLDTTSAPATATFTDIPTDHYAFAAVEACVKAGLIAGQGNGTFGAGANLTREDMAVFFGRALNMVAGKDVVTGQASKLNFSDAASISDYAKDAVGAAFDLGYISGSNGAFDPKGTATREQVASLATRWMKAADTVANNVFAGVTYTDANTLTLNFANEVADIKAADVMVASKADGKAVAVSAVTLSADKKSATVKTDALAGATTYAVTYAGKTVEVTTPDKIDASVAATGAKMVTVTFNSAVDTTKATFSVKKGSISISTASVAWDDAKKVATLTLSSNLTAGDYTVAVNGLANAVSKTFTAEDQKVAKIDINDNALFAAANNANNVNVAYHVFNQYNEDITSGGLANLKVTVGNGVDGAIVTKGTLPVSNAAGYKTGDKITVALLDANSNTFATKTVTVSDAAAVADVAISSLYNKDGKSLSADTNYATDKFYLVVDAKDQYGNAVAAGQIANDVLVSITDNTIADVAGGAATPTFTTMTIDGVSKTVLALSGTPKAGTTKVTIISRTTGKLASYDISVKESVAIDSLNLSAPDLAVAGEDVVIPYSAVDQFGNDNTSFTALSNVQLTTSQDGKGTPAVATRAHFVQNYVTGKAELHLDLSGLSAAGTLNITAITPKNKVQQLNVSYQAQAVAAVITGLKNVNTNFATNGAATLDVSNLVVNDQYGRAYSLTLGTALAGYSVKVVADDASAVSSSNAMLVSGATSTTLTGVAKGVSNYTLTLYKDGAEVANSAYTFASSDVEKADIQSYELADFAKLYKNDAAHDVALTVNGVLANGTKVVVPQAGYYNVNINTGGVTFTGSKIHADNTVGVDATTHEATVPVIVTVEGANGPQTLVKNVVISDLAPSATTVSMMDVGASADAVKVADGVAAVSLATTINAGGAANAKTNINTFVNGLIEVVDQYGIDMTGTNFTDSNVLVTNISNSHTVTTLAAGDTFNVTAITANGKMITFKVIVKA